MVAEDRALLSIWFDKSVNANLDSFVPQPQPGRGVEMSEKEQDSIAMRSWCG